MNRRARSAEGFTTIMNAEAATTDTVAEQGAQVAPEMASSKKGALRCDDELNGSSVGGHGITPADVVLRLPVFVPDAYSVKPATSRLSHICLAYE